MRRQANRNYQSDDVVMTPPALAEALVDALRPFGRILEPAAGNGSFLAPLRRYGSVEACDITDGQPGFTWVSGRVDWIVTNPPWSQFAEFLRHAMEMADHVAMLVTVNHWWTARRVCDVRDAGFGYRQLILCDWPVEWPRSGFQLGMMYIARAYDGPCEIRRLSRPREKLGGDERPRLI